MTVVVDSGILIAFSFPDEPLHNQSKQLMSSWRASETALVAPQLFRSEVTAVIRKLVYQKRFTHEEGRIVLLQLLAEAIEFVEDDDLLKSAYELAARFNRPRAYDSQYLALAERYDCDFWTADETLVNAIKSQFSRIRWLGDFTP